MTQSCAAPQKKISIALQGGGSHGAFAWGVLDKILEDGRLFIEGFSGTSAGGLNALAYIQGFMENGPEGARKSLCTLWKSISEVSVISPCKPSPMDQLVGNFNLDHSIGHALFFQMAYSFSPYQWNPLDFNPLDIVIRKCFDFDKLSKFTDIKAFLCATNVCTGKLKIFTNKDISKETILATTCMPAFFRAAKVGEDFYWDGSYVGNPAIFPLINRCETPDIAVIQLTRQVCPKVPMTSQEISDRNAEINANLSLLREMRAIYFLTELIDSGKATDLKRINMHLIRNENLFSNLSQLSGLNTNWDFIDYLFHWGRKTAQRWLIDNFEDIGVKSSANIESEFVD